MLHRDKFKISWFIDKISNIGNIFFSVHRKEKELWAKINMDDVVTGDIPGQTV